MQVQAESSNTTFVKYEGVGYSGTYEEVTDMNESTGSCSKESTSFSGNLSPLDEDLSVHIRGPIKLNQFAVYYANESGSKKRDLESHNYERALQDEKKFLNKRQDKKQKLNSVDQKAKYKRNADCTQTVSIKKSNHVHTAIETTYVTVTQKSSQDNSGSTDANKSSSHTESSTSTSSSSASSTSSDSKTTDTTNTNTGTDSSSSSSSSNNSTSGWIRKSYYSSDDQASDNLVFMNHLGGSLSGVFSYKFGNSLSYADSTGVGSSTSSQTLGKDTLLESNEEIVLFSSQKCTTDACGYYRNGIDAYVGWSGNYKIFVFEFKMPTSGLSSSTDNYDMPAIWLLNGKIPRTEQYGDCSCWSTGCGELDLWEVITAGSDQLINHIHDGQSKEGDEYNGTKNGGGGSSDYFDRPRDHYVTFAAVFSGSDIYLRDVTGFDFSNDLESTLVSEWMSGTASNAYFV